MSESTAVPARLDAGELIALLRELRAAPRDENFWQRLAVALTMLARAREGLLVAPERSAGWRRLAVCGHADGWLHEQAPRLLGELSARAAGQGFATAPEREGNVVVCVRLLGAEGDVFALLNIPARERGQINELLLRLQLVADIPGSGGGTQAAERGAPAPADDMLELLDLVARVMQEKHFGAAALTLVNGLAALSGCDQVALGWRQAGYARARAISHLDRFERKAENVQLIEAAMEEAMDQEVDIVYPAPVDGGSVVLAHDRFARAMRYGHVCCLVLRRLDEEPQAVVMMAAEQAGADPQQMHRVSVALHLLFPWLADLQDRDRWIGARWADHLWSVTREAFGPAHPVRSFATACAAFLLLYSLIGTMPHRLEASAQLATDSTQIISAPFDGFVNEVKVALGDTVRAGEPLGALDVREFYLQESEIRADLRRYEAEADRARAQGQLADVEIALARVAQSQARLDKVLFYLGQAEIKGPFDGVVVEGDRRDLVGLPVRQGDRMFRLAKVEGLYAVLQVPERDVRHLPAQAAGELRLLAQPGRRIPFRVETVVPVAQVMGQQGNHFWVRVKLQVEPDAWWRPGMSGVARIEAGERTIAWLLMHRLVDLLRMKIWL